MDKERLKQHLINDTTRLFCVLDGASVPELPMQLYKMEAANHCLFKGKLEPDMLYAAPYLVYLRRNDKFTEWVFNEGFGKHWGIFVQSSSSAIEMRSHFRSLVKVYDEQAKSMIFRFYDPRVLTRFLPTCNQAQLKSFFGAVESFYAEEGENLSRFQLDNGSLKRTELS